MNRCKAWLSILVGAMLIVSAATAAAEVVAGRDYRVLATPQPVSSGNRIELLEFFWYGCPHCNNLQPSLTAWLKRKPADVEFKRMPAVFQDSWVPLTKLYFTLDAMGLVDKLHHDVFAAIHEKRIRLQDPNVLFDWVAKQGVDRNKFAQTYNSFAVQSHTQRAKEITARYDIPGTPALVVDGKYLTAPSLILKADHTIDYDRYFGVLEEVIALARKTHGTR
ncbi:MAG TPA: thiol:disulfide interchange protein DsbA/DsbL [Burkholderiales bacterium]|nr:thiol:disulfide interchange protein DsbA/DsbL [Burkholderiales bacterium]